jgi:hypothetical protein
LIGTEDGTVNLNREIEIWHRYGAYLSGVTSIAAARREVSFDQFWAAIVNSGSTGAWSKEAIRNAFEAGRRS